MFGSIVPNSPFLLSLSAVIGMLTAFSSLELAGRVKSATGRANKLWIAAGAFDMGVGLWSLQLIGMLNIDAPFTITYDLTYTLASLLISIAASAVPFIVVNRPTLSVSKIAGGAITFSVGMLLMHFCAIMALQVQARVLLNTPINWLIGCICLAATVCMLALFHQFRKDQPIFGLLKLTSSGMLGLTWAFMHNIGIQSITLQQPSVPLPVAPSGLNQSIMIISSSVSALLILAVTILSSAERKTAEREIVRLNQRTELILNSADEGMIGIDLSGGTTFGNAAAAKILGFSFAELSGRIPYRRFFHNHPDGRWIAPESCPIHMTLTLGTIHHLSNASFVRKDGRSIPVEFMCTPVTERGQITGALVTFKDKTEQKKAEEELLQSEAKFRSLVETANDAILILDSDTVILSWNLGAQQMFGYMEQETIGRKMGDLLAPECQEAYTQWIGSHRYGGKSGHAQRMMELVGIKRTGQRIPVELSLHSWMSNNNQFFSVIIRDVTERKRAEEELRIREERYRRLVESSPDGIIVVNQERILYVNDTGCLMLGISGKTELIGTAVDRLFAPDSIEKVRESIRLAEKGENVEWIEEILVRFDRQTLDVELKALGNVYAGGPSVHLIVRDITERKKAQELFQNSEKLAVLGQLAAGVAHEIRNPLTSIKGFVQLIQMKTKQYEDYYSIILSELDRINFIVSEFLLLAKPQMVEFRRHDLLPLLKDVVTLFGTQAILNGMEIRFACEYERVDVKCVENHLKQVFINILKNSMDAMPGGGEIEIRVRGESEKVVVEFTDNGCGIDKERIPQLGEPFYTTKEKGTGLGLMVTFKIIKDHGGTIEINSEKNVGTTVRVILPIETAPAPVA